MTVMTKKRYERRQVQYDVFSAQSEETVFAEHKQDEISA